MNDYSDYSLQGRIRLGKLIRQTRGGLSYREFDELVGISHGQIRKLELGEVANPDRRTLQKLGAKMGYSFEEIHAILTESPPSNGSRHYYTVEEIMNLVRDLPLSEVGRLGQQIFSYLLALDELPARQQEPSNGGRSNKD